MGKETSRQVVVRMCLSEGLTTSQPGTHASQLGMGRSIAQTVIAPYCFDKLAVSICPQKVFIAFIIQERGAFFVTGWR